MSYSMEMLSDVVEGRHTHLLRALSNSIEQESSVSDRQHEESRYAATASWTSVEAEFEVSGLVEGSCPERGGQVHRHSSVEGGQHTEEAVLRSYSWRNQDKYVHAELSCTAAAAASTESSSCSQSQTSKSFPYPSFVGEVSAQREDRTEFRQSSNPLFEGAHPDESASDIDDTAIPMALLCCRIHPFIQDSASITTVPFYVKWWRDFSRNFCQTLRASLAVSIGAIGFILAYLFELLVEKPYVADSQLKHPWVEIALITFFLARCSAEPACALGSWAYYKISREDKYQGDLSWKGLENCKEVRTTVVAVLPLNHQLKLPRLPWRLRARHKYLAVQSTRDEHMPLPYVPNCESPNGHWDTNPAASISCPIFSSVPEAGEAPEQFSITELMDIGEKGISDAYKDYLHTGNRRLAFERLLDKDEAMLEWLLKWESCWPEGGHGKLSNINANACRMRCMLDAWSKPPSSWGPPLNCLDLPITVINRDGLGVLQVPQCLLSSILPRYGHKSSVDEIAYLSAKAADNDQRYYRRRVALFWFLTMLLTRTCLHLIVRFREEGLIVASVALTALGMWVQFAKGAFRLDYTAMLTGRVLKGCVLKSAWGVRQNKAAVSPSEVTAALLAKWNWNATKESHALLNSFHTERRQENGHDQPIDLDTFQKSGGLLIGGQSAGETGLAILPGRKGLQIRTQYRKDQVHEHGSWVFKNLEFPASEIITHSLCPVGGHLEEPDSEDDSSLSESSEDNKSSEDNVF